MMQMMGMNYGNKDGRKETFECSDHPTWREAARMGGFQTSMILNRTSGDDPPSFAGDHLILMFSTVSVFSTKPAAWRPPRLQWVFDRRASGCLGPGGSQTLHLGFGWKKPAEAGENGQPMSVKTQGQRGWLSVGRWGVPWIRSLVPEDGRKRVQMVEARLSSFHVARRISKTLYINSNLFFGVLLAR